MLSLSLLLFSTPLLALPTLDARAALPTSTNVTLYTGGSSGSCGYDVGSQTWQSGSCYNILTQGVGFALSSTSNRCTFTLYSGSTTCNATASSSVTTNKLPSGSGEQCYLTGVEDGGKYYHGSGIWKCQ